MSDLYVVEDLHALQESDRYTIVRAFSAPDAARNAIRRLASDVPAAYGSVSTRPPVVAVFRAEKVGEFSFAVVGHAAK